ncbi:MAG: UbiA family prenyltransferase [Kiritimatiellia bacterium]|jgi:4-hydroxybenzoate polyprenyltransferase|nr:UbiA family prenyltransferase [Kiritimatiellia bacterium]MDP6629773.1 UbiA family prenyltransferase [Kiritimatiellia bacterium]MDP6811049.1 UbiA family prenyltransferase [Kiritimatiellia bacterium]MDP7023096.1 UbiA family prenyltransferase [Kiritimatiellia bacterium]
MNSAVCEPSEQGADPAPRQPPLRAWLQLVRLPNLFTVPGDPVAGACLAGALVSIHALPQLLVAALAAVAVYAAGLVDNDLVDVGEDRAERPHRPLPAGTVSIRRARALRLLLFALPYLMALALRMPAAWLLTHVALLANILLYNRLKKRSPVAGALLMGLCRTLSMASGMVLAWTATGVTRWSLVALLPWWGYVTGISLLAMHETTRVPDARRYLIILAPLAWVTMTGMPIAPALTRAAVAAAGSAGAVLALDVVARLDRHSTPNDVPPAIGRLVRTMVPMQALCALATPGYGVVFALGLLLCWLLSERVSRRFYAS